MKTIRGAVVVVTGAGSGIGRALAKELASQGAELALADVNAAGLEETRALLGSARCKTFVVDVSQASQVEAFARTVEQEFGRASLLINNAGVALHGTFDQLSLEEFEWLIRINFWGVVYGCKFFMPMLHREPDAHIVNISSVFGLIAPGGQSAYSASKFAVRGFTQSLAQELKTSGINVTCVHPGGIKTRIAANARAGAATRAEEWVDIKDRFEKLARTSPETAAQVIVNGVLQNKARVLIGPDAYQIDFFQRLMPVRGPNFLAAMMEKRSQARGVTQAATAKK
jgi:NAD(P)-dependent dehydrogenase (short-subunit alcohol dehydrogenase family)